MKSRSKMNKWDKHVALMDCKEFEKYLPETHRYTVEKFWDMMKRFGETILKPSVGNGGRGIIKVSKLEDNQFEVHFKKNNIQVLTKTELEKFLRESLGKDSRYLVQYCISLAKVNGKLIDFRYIVQRKYDDIEWNITAKYGKIAADGYVVTNFLNKGKIVSVEEALLHSNILNLDIKKTMDELNHLALSASDCYTGKFKNQTIWGFDLAVDKKGRIWLIEANAAPMLRTLFKSKYKPKDNMIEWYLEYNKKIKGKKRAKNSKN